MLDSDSIEQLRTVFASLDETVVLRVKHSIHADQISLLELLNSLASTSQRILVELSPSTQEAGHPVPAFDLWVRSKPTGISFTGIPGGHEFTSLILAILHSNQKGKLPDPGIRKRIASLRGPIRLRTFISLSCENCPDIVQALNLMATLHPDFHHEMIDGAYDPEQIKILKVQGVPSVFVGDKLLHSGKTHLLDLLEKVENHFGTNEKTAHSENLGRFDTVVIGGGPARASAAIYSIRKGLKTALIAEKIGGQVQETKGIENLISVLYTEGPKLSAQLNEHLQSYPITILEHRRVAKISESNGIKELTLQSGETLEANSVILATGAKWRELGVPGEKEYLGRGVAFCPHCDGPYYKGKKIAVVGGGNSGVEAAIDLSSIVREVVLLEYGQNLKADQVLIDKLKSLPNVSIITNAQTKEIKGDGEKVTSLDYQEQESAKIQKIQLDGVFVQIGLLPNSHLVKDLVNLTKSGEIIIDSKGRTSVPGIYAAGDVTTVPYKQIIIAMGEGAKAALAAFEDRAFK